MLVATPALSAQTHPLLRTFGSFAEPSGIGIDRADGNVLVADGGLGETVHIFGAEGEAPSGVTVTEIPGFNFGGEPSGVAVDNSATSPSKGAVYVTDVRNNAVKKFTLNGSGEYQLAGELSATPAFGEPLGVTVDASGHVFVADYGSSSVVEFSPTGAELARIDVSSSVGHPSSVALDSAGDLFVQGYGGSGVYRFQANESGTIEPGTPTEVIASNATGIAVDQGSEALYVALGDHVAQYSLSGEFEGEFGAGALTSTQRLAVSASTGDVYVTDRGADDVAEFGPGVTVPSASTGEARDISTTTATVAGTVNPEGVELQSCTFEYGDTEAYGQTASCEGPDATELASASEPVAVHTRLSGLAQGADVHYRLLASNANGTIQGSDRTFRTVGSPVIAGEYVASALASEATVSGQIDPEGSSTSYRIEYGTDTSYGLSTQSVGIGAGKTALGFTAKPAGLAPSSTYHWRVVATNAVGTSYSADHTFTTVAATTAELPDDRAYELISPANKNGGEIDGGAIEGDFNVPLQASEDGGGVTYASATSFDTAAGSGRGAPAASTYISRRGPNGWSTQNVTPPSNTTTEPNAFSVQASTIEAMAPDLSSDFFVSNSPLLPGAFAGYITPYVQEPATGATQALLSSPPPNLQPDPSGSSADLDPVFAGASHDFSHVIFSANDTLTPGATGSTEFGENNLYEWAAGHLSLVNVLPDGSALSSASKPSFGATTLTERHNLSHAISSDGSRVFWTDGADEELFARVNGTSTVLVSRSQKTNGTGPGGGDPLGTKMPLYQGASTDGSSVFFTSTEELTNDANTGDASSCAPEPGDCAPDLYSFSVETDQLTDLTVDTGDAKGADVQGVLGSSDDGSYVYFVANGALAGGAATGDCYEALEGLCNLYVWHAGEGIHFIAKVPARSLGSSSTLTKHPFLGMSSETVLDRTSRVSPSGRYVTFQTKASLTGYDNAVAHGSCEGPEQFNEAEVEGELCPEVYLYDASSGRLACASCNPTGAKPIGPSALPFRVGSRLGRALYPGITGPGWETEAYQQRYLSDSGRLFFDSVDALSPRDSNDSSDVYEYENGQVRLISGGYGGEASVFSDASASADDVFFLTRDRLVPEDQDQAVDLYDARVGATASTVGPPPCASGDACKPAPSPQPDTFGAPASATFSGAGNPHPPAAAPPKKVVSPTRAQRLAKALKQCRKRRSKSKRHACEKAARKRYGPAANARKSRKKTHARNEGGNR